MDTVGGGIGVTLWYISRTSWKIITKFAWIYFFGHDEELIRFW